MDEKRRAEIRLIVDHFRDKMVNQNVIKEFCNLNHIEPIVLGDLQDYVAQVKHDEVVSKMFPLILAELQKLQYKPEFASEAERKKIEEQNDEVRVNIVKIFEESALQYRFVTTLSDELGNFVGGKIALAGTTAFNKALEVLMLLAKEKFGGEFNMKHAADFAKDFFARSLDKKGDKAENTANEPANKG